MRRTILITLASILVLGACCEPCRNGSCTPPPHQVPKQLRVISAH